MNTAARTHVGIGYFNEVELWVAAASKAGCTFEKRSIKNRPSQRIAVASDGAVIGKFAEKQNYGPRGFLVSSADAMRALHRYGPYEVEYSKGPESVLTFLQLPQWLRKLGSSLAARYATKA